MGLLLGLGLSVFWAISTPVKFGKLSTECEGIEEVTSLVAFCDGDKHQSRLHTVGLREGTCDAT